MNTYRLPSSYIIFLILLIYFLHNKAFAQNEVSTIVKEHVVKNFKDLDGVLDLKILRNSSTTKNCSNKMQAKLAYSKKISAANTVVVYCDTPKWQLNVPIRVKLIQKAVFAKRDIPKNHVITASDLTVKEIDLLATNKPIIKDLKHLIGKQSKNNISLGNMLTENMFTEETVIYKDRIVNVIYNLKNLTIKNKATAIEDGKLGEIIRLKTIKTNTIITGKVIDHDTVDAS